MKKRKKLTLASITLVVVSMLMGAGISIAAGAPWRGTDQVSRQLDYSNKIEGILAAQEHEISNLLKALDGTISKKDHDAILEMVSFQKDQLKNLNDKYKKLQLDTTKQLQDKDTTIQNLNAKVADLNAQLEQAYNDAVMVNKRLEKIYNKYK